jgi:hypothetical protein
MPFVQHPFLYFLKPEGHAMQRVTSKMVAEWKASPLPVSEMARRYGVADTTVYHHINKKHADRRREQWRVYRAKRRQDPEFRRMELEATRRYQAKIREEGSF